MFKHIALTTDGSKLADKGVKAGMQLAQSLGARVTGVYVIAPYRPSAYGEAARIVTAPRPHEGIRRAARSAKCDAIAMASHGRGAISNLLLGSETSRVLAHSKLPVLVTR